VQYLHRLVLPRHVRANVHRPAFRAAHNCHRHCKYDRPREAGGGEHWLTSRTPSSGARSARWPHPVPGWRAWRRPCAALRDRAQRHQRVACELSPSYGRHTQPVLGDSRETGARKDRAQRLLSWCSSDSIWLLALMSMNSGESGSTSTAAAACAGARAVSASADQITTARKSRTGSLLALPLLPLALPLALALSSTVCGRRVRRGVCDAARGQTGGGGKPSLPSAPTGSPRRLPEHI
jgi:hypothetical protein